MATITEDKEVTNSRWIRQAFFKRNLGGAGANSSVLGNSLNYYDTTLGGNRSINPPPQYTRFSDAKLKSIAPECKGMGNYYKEAHDDNAQRISLQFGIPEYNSLSSVMANFYDRGAANLANYGNSGKGLFYTAGKALGVVFTLPLQAFYGLNYVYNRLSSVITGDPYSKFYYLNPTMALYWNAVAVMFNKIAVDMGVIDNVETSDVAAGVSTTINDYQGLLPDVIRTKGDGNRAIIDVKALSSRSQRLANSFNQKIMDIDKQIANSGVTGEEAAAAFKSQVKAMSNSGNLRAERSQYSDMPSYVEGFLKSPIGDGENIQDIVPELNDDGSAKINPDTGNLVSEGRSVRNRFEEMAKYLQGDLREGSAFVTFNVEKTGPIAHSFSNSTKAAPLKEAANAISQNSRDLTVNLAGGNLTDNAIGNAFESIIGGVKDLVGGALDSVGLQGLGAIAGGALMDMPDVYEDSNADLNQTTYKMRLATPYGNKFSILTRVYFPLCCILAGVFPRSTGKGSYTQPFLCRLHSQGFEEVKLGIMKDVQIELGTSNIGRNIDNLPTAVDVSFTVESMDKMVHMPITDSILDSVTGFSAFDEDTVFSDFLGTLAGTSLQDQYYASNRLSRATKKTIADWDSFASPAYFSQWFASTMPGKTISAFLAVGEI